MSENKYREYLDDKRWYLEHLKNKGEPQYDEGYGGILAAAGLIGGGYVAFRKGLLKNLAHQVLQGISRYRPGRAEALFEGFKKMAEHPIWNMHGNTVMKTIDVLKQSPEIFAKSFKDHEIRARQLSKQKLYDSPMELTEAIQDRLNTLQRLSKWRENGTVRKDLKDHEIDDIMLREIRKQFEITDEEQAKHMARTGHQFATFKDVENELTSKQRAYVQQLEAAMRKNHKDVDISKWVVDKHILIDEHKQIADLRAARHVAGKFVDSFANDFGIPLVHFNPVKLLYLDKFLSNRREPLFALLHPNSRNPLMTGHNGFVGSPLLFARGNVFDTAKDLINPIARDTYLVSAKEGTVARLVRNLAGIPMATFKRPTKGFWNKLRYDVADMLDIGMQDEPIRRYRDDFGDTHGIDWLSPADWVSKMADSWNKKFPLVPKGSKTQNIAHLDQAFGSKNEAEYLIMRGYKPLNESNSFHGYMEQFFASRTMLNKDPSKITTASLFGYAFFERLNAAINSVGLGLSTRSMGSGMDIAKNLFLKRFVPIYAGIEVLSYGDYVSSMILDEPLSHKFAKFYKATSIDMAEARDALGITEWAKSWAGVFVGGEQLSEFPVVGRLLDLNDNADETRDYWEHGVDPIRKGRWWDLGNTPFTGGKVDYFRPNWVRETLADIPYSDTMYGSRQEYWDHSWLPTPTNPLAPIRHFLTDPYWFERKHYQDRPYLQTGGIPELAEIPVLGPILNDTIGQILKPTKEMHQDWKSEQKQEDALKYGRHTVDTVIPAIVDPANNAVLYNAAASMGSSVAEPKSYAPSGVNPADAGVAAIPTDAPANINISSIPAIPEGETIAYTTATGGVQVMSVAPGADMRKINEAIKNAGIKRTGDVQSMRLADADPDVVDLFTPKPDPLESTALSMAIGNIHYNLAEIGGIYGYGSTLLTGELYDDRPTIQNSMRATSYERAFWDQDIGGIGGEGNEIFRRFLPHRRRQIDEYNPVRNQMPSWMPGSDYYTDFQHGDPYVKVKLGEERLPGEAYERLWGVKDPMKMSIGASFIGKSQDEIVSHFLKRKELDMEDSEDILNYGEKVHKQYQTALTSAGVMIDYEQRIEDKKNAINGFYDGRVRDDKFREWAAQNSVVAKDPGDEGFQEAILEMKTMGKKAFNSGDVKQEHLAQLNFYMGQTGRHRGYLMYLNRDNPDDTPVVRGYDFSPELYEQSIQNVQEARGTVKQMINNGVIGPGDMYPILDRFRILADVAPYSQEFRELRDQIGKLDMTEDERKQVQDIRKQVAQKKKFTRMYDYKFETANTKEETVHVKRVLDNNTFLTEEYPDNPIKLAGIRVPMGKDDEIAQKAKGIIHSYLEPGAEVKILVDADPLTKVKNDTYQTIGAVVEVGHIKNLNQELLKKGLAKERDTDDSAPGIVARYTPFQRTVGNVWEWMAHLDTVFNTKFLQVRSPIESYERREVYGKDWQSWDTPVESFIVPLINQTIHAGPLAGAGGGAFIGMLTGRNRFARIVGGALGGAVGAALGLYGNLHNSATGKEWIPEERQKEWDINEYVDTLHFMKDRMLFAQYAKEAKAEEGFDVRKYVEMNKRMGKKRKMEIDELQKLKRLLKFADTESEKANIRKQIRKLANYEGPSGDDDKDLLRALNQKIFELSNTRDVKKLGPKSAKALLYYQDSKQTLYGYESGEPLQNLLAALPKKDREYLIPFMEAPEEERGKILRETPVYLRRALEASWGLPIEEKEDLNHYFTKHELPNADWVGWDERVNLDDVKIKMVQKEAMDQSEFDIWDDGVKRADQQYIKTPNVYRPELISNVHNKLRDLLARNGLHEVDVQVEKTKSGRIDVDMKVQKDRRREIMDQLNSDGESIFA